MQRPSAVSKLMAMRQPPAAITTAFTPKRGKEDWAGLAPAGCMSE